MVGEKFFSFKRCSLSLSKINPFGLFIHTGLIHMKISESETGSHHSTKEDSEKNQGATLYKTTCHI